MDLGFGNNSSNDDINSSTVEKEQEPITPIDGGNNLDSNGIPIVDLSVETSPIKSNNSDKTLPEVTTDDVIKSNNDNLISGTEIEFNEKVYTINDKGDLIDKDGSIFKSAKDVNSWIKEVGGTEDKDSISINTIKDAIGVEITDDNDTPIVFDNTPDGIKSYINAVLETSAKEQTDAAINSFYNKYPFIADVVNYYTTNGNSLEGFGEVPDRSNITIDDSNEIQQESIIREAWEEQNRKGDVNAYIQYLKSSGTLLAVAKSELAGLQEYDEQVREENDRLATEAENKKIDDLQTYWTGVKQIIDDGKIAGYKIPETIIINRNGQKVSASRNDFFNYLYRVDDNGESAYQQDLKGKPNESRKNDEILRAYLTFVGGTYSNLVDMAINEKEVTKLRIKAKEKPSTSVRVTTPGASSTKIDNINFGY